MNTFNFKSHDDIPESLANYVVSVCSFSGLKVNDLTDIKLSDINSFLNGLEDQEAEE
tara:strand:- start:847 stop:1017 length:171 start_codon:yes stop_codon:yes gene_type:complete